ncbi:hypothetical protein K461DRAFT_160735 [Myriangium duriaei CBS 260.36]|uniref:Uncharacterized protein n=1 Tax=Myriangium duriaei CBS 260.36 TaxID=1168546 RepID=A0A9P4MGD8_9PEZI|nr:hypothetical protein K461DRAFT_160735 [Myriangium duriaei CBS 260.36]
MTRYDHTRVKASDPVRSPVNKRSRDLLVVAWVTSSESRLLYFLPLPCTSSQREKLAMGRLCASHALATSAITASNSVKWIPILF